MDKIKLKELSDKLHAACGKYKIRDGRFWILEYNPDVEAFDIITIGDDGPSIIRALTLEEADEWLKRSLEGGDTRVSSFEKGEYAVEEHKKLKELLEEKHQSNFLKEFKYL